MLSEADIRIEIDEALRNKGWKLSGVGKNVFTPATLAAGQADYVLRSKTHAKPLVIIETKRKNRDLKSALEQAICYAGHLGAPIAYASDGSATKTIHLATGKPLMFNGEEIDWFISESLAFQYLHTNEHNTVSKKVIKSRKDLLHIFAGANKELRKEGLQAGLERFSEFCNILFLKIFSEELELAEGSGKKLHTLIPKDFRWDYFKNKDGNELLSYVNNVVLGHFQKEYGADIFSPLQLQNPIILKKIIDDLDPLSLVDTNSDIKGDAFEYFLKAYLANQSKDLGEYFTPRHIIKTVIKLVNPKFGESVYDPFCGTGGMLIESFKHIYNKMPMSERNLEVLKKDTIFGSEITKNARITKMNMLLTGDGHNNIIRQDSLRNSSKRKHDVVITNIPFSLGNFEGYSGFYKLGNNNGNSLCIEHCFDAISNLSANPRIGMIIPEGILFDKKFTKLRDYIYKNSHVQDIISLPVGAFKPYTDVKTSILYLTQVNKKVSTQKSIWHFTVKNDGHALNTRRQRKEGENDFDIFLAFHDTDNKERMLEIGFNKLDMEVIKNNAYVSIPGPYKKFEFGSLFQIIQLSELVEEVIIRNKNLSSQLLISEEVLTTKLPIKTTMKADSNISAPIWSVTNKNGGVFVPQEQFFEERVASNSTDNYKLVLANHFAYSPPRVNVGSIALNLSDNIGCVSPMYVVFKTRHKLNAKYLYWLLQSPELKEQIKFYAYGSVRQTLNFNDFCKMKIPLPSVEKQIRIVEELESYNNIIQNSKDSIESWFPHFEIDDKWQIVQIRDICNNVAQYGISEEMNEQQEGYKILRMGNLQKGIIDFTDIKYVNISKELFEQYKLNNGDILFNRTNSFELVGKTSIFKNRPLSRLTPARGSLGDSERRTGVHVDVHEDSSLDSTYKSPAEVEFGKRVEEDYCFASYLVRIVIDTRYALPEFVNFFMNSSLFKQTIKSHAKQSNNQANINAQILLAEQIPLPPLAMQEQIVNRLELERKMMEYQNEIITLFQKKIEEKLKSLWSS